jgi:molecular chaperone GrpE
VADILSRATESVPADALAAGNAYLKSLHEGLVMTEAQLQKVFTRHGLVKVNPVGEKFNPNEHEALFEQVCQSKVFKFHLIS